VILKHELNQGIFFFLGINRTNLRSVKHHNKTIKMCKYDHIAMIAKLGDDQIYLFETSPYESDFSSSYNNQNSRAKVMLTGWKKFRASNYDKLYRK